jgi:hypothetical protein
MIKLIKHGNNETEISNGNTPVESVFFSYSTAVAGLDDKGFWKTDKFYSTTTSKHINQWLRKNLAFEKVRILPQKEVEEKLKA